MAAAACGSAAAATTNHHHHQGQFMAMTKIAHIAQTRARAAESAQEIADLAGGQFGERNLSGRERKMEQPLRRRPESADKDDDDDDDVS